MTCYFEPKTGSLVFEDGKLVKVYPPKFHIFKQAKRYCDKQGIKLVGLFCGVKATEAAD